MSHVCNTVGAHSESCGNIFVWLLVWLQQGVASGSKAAIYDVVEKK